MPLTYGSYLKIDDLLSLQKPKSAPEEHDEMLFIIIHQAYELWFKQLLHELDHVKQQYSAGDLFGAMATYKRARAIMKTAVGMVDILETLTPLSFASFRERLESASGFQSYQFRELQFVLGQKRSELIANFEPGSEARIRLERRLAERTVIDHFYDFLVTRGASIPRDRREAEVTAAAQPSPGVQTELRRMYDEQPDARLLFEEMVDFDEGLQEWHYRHVKVVERTIGNKIGTGGSSGVEYLKRALFIPIFPDLWTIRHQF